MHDVVDQGTAAGELGVGEPGPVLRQLAVVDAGDAEDRPEASAAQLGDRITHRGEKRTGYATMSSTPARSQASRIAIASSTVVASGFSHSTCTPAAAACSTRAR